MFLDYKFTSMSLNQREVIDKFRRMHLKQQSVERDQQEEAAVKVG